MSFGGDFLTDWEVIGPYQHAKASATPDNGDDLDGGQWDDAAEIPFNDANYAQYSDPTQKGVVTTHQSTGGKTPGPYGDSRIDGDSSIIGASWHVRWQSKASTWKFYFYYGDIPSGTPTVDGTTEKDLGNAVVPVDTLVVSEVAADVPDTSEYFQYGFGTKQGVPGCYDNRMCDCACFVLHEPVPPPWKEVTLGTGVPGRMNEKEVLVG